MFNSKSKKRIEELETANANLQKQYDLVHGFLLQRQDEVVALRRELVIIRSQTVIAITDQQVKSDFVNAALELQERLNNGVANLQDLVKELGNLVSDSDSDSDEDEDEDEDEDDSWDD